MAVAVACFIVLLIKWCVANHGFPISKINSNGPVQFFLYAVRVCRVGQEGRQGRAGQGRVGRGGQGKAGQGRAGEGRRVGRAGQGRVL